MHLAEAVIAGASTAPSRVQIHERGVNEDLLLVILKAVMRRRPDLKVVLMSATLNADKFAAFFPGAAAVHVPGFTFPVTVKYLGDALVESGVTFTPPEVPHPPPPFRIPPTLQSPAGCAFLHAGRFEGAPSCLCVG